MVGERRWGRNPGGGQPHRALLVGHSAFVLSLLFGATGMLAQTAPAPFTTEVSRTPAPPVAAPPGMALSPWPDIAPLLPPTAEIGAKIQVRSIEVRGDTRRTDIVLLLSRRTKISAFAIADPMRVIIDGARLHFDGVTEKPSPRKMLISDYRFGPLDAGTARLLFDAAAPVKVAAVSGRVVEGGAEVTISILPAGRAVRADQPTLVWGATADAPPPQSSDRAGTLSATLPLLMIDPGHGGIDPGAVADQAVLEKDVVLAVARRLMGVLETRGKVRVAMTRQGDETVPLDKRVAVTRAAGADLFLSLHADTFAGPAGAALRGGSVYVLGVQASNAIARALAEKENTADQRAGIAGAIEGGDAAVDGILADLTARETQTLSHVVQDTLVRHLRRSILLAREPARAAAFRVLKHAETPSVLIELGYMSNGQDIALLQSAEWQTSVAVRIADAVETFFARPRGFALGR